MVICLMPMPLIRLNMGTTTSSGRNQPSKATASVTRPSPNGARRDSSSSESSPQGGMKSGWKVKGDHDSTRALKQYP